MPGLAVILTEPGRPELAASLTRMLAVLAAPADARNGGASYQSALLALPEMGVAIGHVECPAFPGTGPARLATPRPGEAVDVSAMLEGELPDVAALAERLGLPPTVAPARLIATLYGREGATALESLTGHWAVAIVDRARRQVVIANDTFGVRPLYRLRADDGAWLLASHPAALLAYPGVSREVNPAGLADMLAFGQTWGRKTLFRGVELLPPATILTWAGGQMSECRYWQPAPQPGGSSREADLETARGLFNESVARLAAIGGPVGLALSGGLDSRALLSALLVAGIKPSTLTHSIVGATDQLLGAQVAAAAGTTHHFYEVRGELLLDQIMPGVRLLGGQIANIDVHPLCFMDDMAGYARAMFTGLGGNVHQLYFGPAYVSVEREVQNAPALTERILPTYNRALSMHTDFPALLRPDWLAAFGAQPRQSILEAVEATARSAPWNEVANVIYLEERVRKYLTKGDMLVRQAVETRHPFMDRRLFTHTWSLPRSVREGSQIHRYIITRNAPALADLIYEREGAPARLPCTWQERGREIARHARRRIERWLGHPYTIVYPYRYADWIRGPLRPLFEEVLLDPRTAARPYFRHETIRRWLAEQMAGQNHAAQLSVLLALELTLRNTEG